MKDKLCKGKTREKKEMKHEGKHSTDSCLYHHQSHSCSSQL